MAQLTWLVFVVAAFSCVEIIDAQTGTQKPEFIDVSFLDGARYSESKKPGEVLGTLRARDPDNRGPIKYSLAGEVAEYVEANEVTGVVTIKVQFDYELDSKLTVIIIATDVDGDEERYYTNIDIIDANDLPPTFSETVYKFDLNENTPVGTFITSLTVRDQDTENQLITVRCDNSTLLLQRACQVFGVTPTYFSNKEWRGNITLQEALDYEKEKSYSIRLIAFDGVNYQPQEIQIGVLDINDSPPYFVRALSSVIDETDQIGVNIDYVLAEDSDEVNRRPIRYELYGDEEALEYFTINPIGGNISNKVPLDYEDPNRTPGTGFRLEIRARELLQVNPDQLGNDNTTTATAVITIRLRDINDNCPVFDESEYRVQIREDITQGVNIPLQMTVTDKDSGSRASFDLSLVDVSGQFAVTPTSAQSPASVTIAVVNAQNIDYESLPNTYNLVVTARENQVTPACSGSARVIIDVTDVNDEVPRFDQDYRRQVIETAPGGTSIVTVYARDGEAGKFGQDGIRYSLFGSGAELFNIDPISGVVTVADCLTPGVAPCLDYEKENRYDLAVEAKDNEGVSDFLRSSVQLTIDVLNANDNPPVFRLSYRRSIREGETQTTDPLVIQAQDLDGDNITYSIVQGPQDARLWQVNPVTGNVTAIRPIQYSDVRDPDTGVFVFEALASDGENDVPVNIEIKVIDINDKPPIFLPSNYTVYVLESTPPNECVLRISVTDGDSPTTGNGQVDVYIDSGNFGKFVTKSVPRENNVILTDICTSEDATFDYDVQPVFNLIVKAQDRGSPTTLTGTASVTVFIIDTNNRLPYFNPPTHSVTVFENRPIDYTVTTIPAFDNDADADLRLSFIVDQMEAFGPSGEKRSISDIDYTQLFRIDAITGVVQVNARLDRDQVNLMQIPLLVRDVAAVGQSGTGMLFIRILEYNEDAPYFEFPFYNFSIKEERPRGAFVGSLLAFDVDDTISAYQLLSNPERLFTISTTSGVLQVNGRLDYEERHNATVIAMALDSGQPQLRNTTVVFINIININDNSPIFERPTYDISLLEEETTTAPLLRVSATDKDEEDYGVIRYRLDPNEQYFRIDEITGEIFYKDNHPKFDREKISTYSFQVTAEDSPNHPLERLRTSVPVYVTIIDKNDNCPEFQQSRYSGTVIETADVFDQVVEIYAVDADTLENGQIVFSINATSANPPESAALFSIQRYSGRVVVGSSLRNRPGTYRFDVVASDLGGDNSSGEMCSTSVPVEIRVTEAINDVPVWIRPPTANFSIDVLESQYLGMLVYDCKATDRNPGNAGIIDYAFNVRQILVEKTPEFRINPVTCIIRAEMVYDREEVESYVVTIVAKDRGDPPASSETVLIIRVLDVNDNDPEFPMRDGETRPYNFNLEENTLPENGVIGTVMATDRDTDHVNNRIFYKIVAGNEDDLFILDMNTGEIRLNTARAPNGLDRESSSLHSMDVLAYNDVQDDSVIRERKRRSTNPSIVTVNIAVDDQDDTAPEFLEDSYLGCVPIDAPFAQSILRVEATDQDLVGSLDLTYSNNTKNDNFEIESRSGIIRNAKLLYDVNNRVQNFGVRATDGAGQFSSVPVTIFVTDSDRNEVKLQVSQPASDVRVYQDQLISVLRNNTVSSDGTRIVLGCIREIRDHVNADGSFSYTSADVLMSAVGQRSDGSYFIYTKEELARIMNNQLGSDATGPSYRALYIKTVEVESEEEDSLSLKEDAVLAIFIIVILLIFLALIVFLLACFLIRSSKRRKVKKLRAERHTHVEVVKQQQEPEVMMSVNPVFNNRGFQPEPSPPQPQPQPPPAMEDEYAVVVKRHPPPDDREPQPIPVQPPVVPVVIPAPEQDEGPEPVIITEPVMEDEKPLMQPPPEDFFEKDDDPVPVIETEVLPDDELPGPSGLPEADIEVEIRDTPPESPKGSPQGSPQGSPRGSPRGSPSPPRSQSPASSPRDSAADEYRFETNVM